MKIMKWRLYGRVFLDVVSQRGVGRGLGLCFGIVVVLGMVMVRLLRAHQWLGAGVCLLIMLSPFVVGAWLWRSNRMAAIEEARQARSPLNLP
jgi:UPF0716 family protein affecting phage T7 exclusion